MWQGHLSRRAPCRTFPCYQPSLLRVWTPTPDGFERFLLACVGLSRDEGLPPLARGPQARFDARRAADIGGAFSF